MTDCHKALTDKKVSFELWNRQFFLGKTQPIAMSEFFIDFLIDEFATEFDQCCNISINSFCIISNS